MAHVHEVEVKVLDINRKAIEPVLLAAGAKKVFDDRLEAVSFKPKAAGVATLRLRKEGDRTFLAIKINEKVDSAKVADEFSVEIADLEEARIIFEKLGYECKHHRIKHRTSYVLGDVRFEFDKLLGEHERIPEFLEIEAKSDADLQSAIDLLHIDKEQLCFITNSGVIRHYA